MPGCASPRVTLATLRTPHGYPVTSCLGALQRHRTLRNRGEAVVEGGSEETPAKEGLGRVLVAHSLSRGFGTYAQAVQFGPGGKRMGLRPTAASAPDSEGAARRLDPGEGCAVVPLGHSAAARIGVATLLLPPPSRVQRASRCPNSSSKRSATQRSRADAARLPLPGSAA